MIICEEKYNWRKFHSNDLIVWLSGYIYNYSPAEVVDQLLTEKENAGNYEEFLMRLDGHFAIIAEDKSWYFAAVDRVRSIPVFYSDAGAEVTVSYHAPTLVKKLNLTEFNENALISFAMSGYTIHNDTIYEQLGHLGAGEYIAGNKDQKIERKSYYKYRPWSNTKSSADNLEKDLSDVTFGILEKVIKSAKGETIAVALSAGMDSRLIVSGLAELGYDNVKCFAYGRHNNYEAEASRKIAQHLGYEWTFVPFTNRSQKKFLKSTIHEDYLKYADTCTACQFEQDLPAVMKLLESGFIDKNAVLINGNSGDYISGLHIQPQLLKNSLGRSHEERIDNVLDVFINKHFRLWDFLSTKKNDKIIKDLLLNELTQDGLLGAVDINAQSIYEYLEYYNRQSKYTINGQRIYDFLGMKWRSPLWDNDYLEFWEGVPLSLKARQILYRKMLYNSNWGGVWKGGEWYFSHEKTEPGWISLFYRPLLRIISLAFQISDWHKIEARFLNYWNDILAYHTLYPYVKFVADNRGSRNFVSYYSEMYLKNRGIEINSFA